MTPFHRVLAYYQLPDHEIVRVDDSAAKGAAVIDFTMRGGHIVSAVRVRVTPDTMFTQALQQAVAAAFDFGHSCGVNGLTLDGARLRLRAALPVTEVEKRFTVPLDHPFVASYGNSLYCLTCGEHVSVLHEQ